MRFTSGTCSYSLGATLEHGRASVYFLEFRWSLEWRVRITCHKCRKPATLKCVLSETPEWRGPFNSKDEWPRDPLCDAHGKIGDCPDSTERWRQVHMPLVGRARFAYGFEKNG
jgi:hypothetical protein